MFDRLAILQPRLRPNTQAIVIGGKETITRDCTHLRYIYAAGNDFPLSTQATRLMLFQWYMYALRYTPQPTPPPDLRYRHAR